MALAEDAPAEDQEQVMAEAAEEAKREEARQNAVLASTALKEQQISAQDVNKLQDIDYFKFERQLKRQAHNFSWPKWILDLTVAEPV